LITLQPKQELHKATLIMPQKHFRNIVFKESEPAARDSIENRAIFPLFIPRDSITAKNSDGEANFARQMFSNAGARGKKATRLGP
jgi:hypothetical protein